MRRAQIAREVTLPGCKSLSARALILAACASGESRLTGLSDSEDTRLLAAALEALGAAQAARGGELRIQGWGGAPEAAGLEIEVGAAASSLRFLLPLLAAGRTDVLICGEPRLFQRPHEPLLEFLRDHGARIEPEAGLRGRPGLRVQGSGLAAGEWRPPVAASSQYLSGLLLAAGLCGEVKVAVEGVVPSAGYVDLTLEAMRIFRGPAVVRTEPGGWRIAPGAPQPAAYSVPGDPSGATFFLVALLLRGGRARFQPPWSAVHPEARLLRSFFDAGLLRADQDGLEATGHLPEEPLVFDLDPAPDAGPALAVLGAALPCGLRLRGAGRLRLKESDRVAGIRRLLEALGQELQERGDELVVPGGGLDPARLAPGARAGSGPAAGFDPGHDHRLAMAAGIAGLVVPSLAVRDADCVAKSFPRFWEEREAWLDT